MMDVDAVGSQVVDEVAPKMIVWGLAPGHTGLYRLTSRSEFTSICLLSHTSPAIYAALVDK